METPHSMETPYSEGQSLHTRGTKRRRRGQGMTEYILIVSLIALGTIGVVGIFGDTLRGMFLLGADALAGEQVSKDQYVKPVVGNKFGKRDISNFSEKRKSESK